MFKRHGSPGRKKDKKHIKIKYKEPKDKKHTETKDIMTDQAWESYMNLISTAELAKSYDETFDGIDALQCETMRIYIFTLGNG